MENNTRVSTETIVRTIVMFVTLANTILISIGKNPLPFAEEQLFQFLSGAATIIAGIWAWWKNNSFTKNARKADVYLDELKTEVKTDG